MILFRTAQPTDLDGIYQLSQHTGVGMTTLPDDKDFLERRLTRACDSLKKRVLNPGDEYYLFVLEDLQNDKIVGTSAIEACTGHDLPFYSYQVSPISQSCDAFNIRSDYELLTPTYDNEGKSELCTLFLEPHARHSGNGLLLSRARFLFMADHPERFAPIIVAELRGVSDEAGHSPFWEHVGQHFFHMPFARADHLTMTTDKKFIADLLPKTPIYINLLPKEAQNVIGKPNEKTVPAMNILVNEGFYYKNTVDIFDGGPTIEAAQHEIKTIAQSLIVTIQTVVDDEELPHTPKYLLSNRQLNLRATIGSILFDERQQTGIVSKKTAQLLQINPGEQLRITPL